MKKTIGIIGGGNMGAAIIAGIIKEYPVVVCEHDKKRRGYLKKKYGLTAVSLERLALKADVIVLAVKPQSFDQVLKELKPLLTARHLVVSIAAGITTKYIEKRLGKGARVIRTMPNLPARVGKGVTAVCKGKNAGRADVLLTSGIFNRVGKSLVMDEKWIDGVTAVSGSGPAYVFLFVELMQDAARSLGFNKSTSEDLVMQTLRGSVELLAAQKTGPGVLRARVTSKGGTTQAAMDVFFENGIGKIFDKALKAARKRAKELSK